MDHRSNDSNENAVGKKLRDFDWSVFADSGSFELLFGISFYGIYGIGKDMQETGELYLLFTYSGD